MIGVLALQGNFSSHVKVLGLLGHNSKLVKSPKDLDDIDGLVIPGGESTTMTKLINRDEKFFESIQSFSKNQPILGTCAGLILMSKDSFDSKVINLGIIDIESTRNAYGRQVHSFDAELSLEHGSKNDSFKASFIRAPKISKVGKKFRWQILIYGPEETNPPLPDRTFLWELIPKNVFLSIDVNPVEL